jgi:hypothetical protein
MVSLTDSELDCVMNAARPLDVSARDAFLREGRARWRAAPRSATAWCTGSSPRFSVDIFCRPNLTTEKPDARAHLAGIVAVFAGEARLHPFRSRGGKVSDALTRRKGA